MKNIKQFLETTKQVVKEVFWGLDTLIEALSLLAVSGFSIWAAYNVAMPRACAYGLAVSGAVIALRAAYEFVRHMQEFGKIQAKKG